MADDESAVPPERSSQPPEAAWTVVLENIGLIHHVIKNHCPSRNGRDDLVQEGLLGLLEAARRFDPTRQVAFSTYAYYWVKHFVLAALRKERSIVSTTESAYVANSLTDVDIDDLGFEGDEMQAFLPTLESHEVEYIRNDMSRDLREHLVDDLDEIERLVVVLHWLSSEPSTLDDIAKALGLRSRSSVLEIENLALSKLKQAMSKRRQK